MSYRPKPAVSAALVLLLLALTLLGFGIYRQNSLERSSSELAIATTESIFSSGSAAMLVANAHASLLAQQDEISLTAYITSIPVILGPLQAISSIRGGAPLSVAALFTAAPQASYEMELVFAGSPAVVLADMVREGGNWYFTSYQVNSERLFN